MPVTGIEAMCNQQLCNFSATLKACTMHRRIAILLRDGSIGLGLQEEFHGL